MVPELGKLYFLKDALYHVGGVIILKAGVLMFFPMKKKGY
jgi:hypothetical protein